MNPTLKPHTMSFLLLQNEEGGIKALYFIERKNVFFPFFKGNPSHEYMDNTSYLGTSWKSPREMKNFQDEPNITDVSIFALEDSSETRAKSFKMYTAKIHRKK